MKIKNFIIYGVVVLLAVTTGLLMGELYGDSLIPLVDTFSTQEIEIRDDEKDIEKLYNDAISGKKTSFSGKELYQIAEYKLKQRDSFMKVLTGDVESMGFAHQQLRSNKVLYNNQIYYLKMSPNLNGTPMAPSMAVWMNYEIGSDRILMNESRNINDITGDNKDNFNITLGRDGATEWSLEKYRSFFKTDITTPLTYIISDFTCGKGSYDDNITLNENGQYVFEINLSYEFAAYAALYYSFEITHFLEANTIPTVPPQSSSDLPQWESVSITGVMDSEFNLISLSYVEKYRVDQVIKGAPVTNTLVDNFYYDEETITSYLESIGEL